ncbi:MAG: hypothetical protein Q7S35_01820 [Candidatus Limnocylindrales bacterium]|nr:hypothetical protein [Candidatus Limnocylindrales bacterium]
MRIKSVLKHSAQALAEGSLIALLVVGLMAGSVFAAKPAGAGQGKPGGGSGTGTISLALMDGAAEAHFAARVTFNVSTTATAYPYVHLMCSQNGSLVAEGRQGFFPTALGNEWFYLGPTPAWQSGAADCTANLEKYTSKGWSVLGSTTFHVYE